jgi:hypothetical protein
MNRTRSIMMFLLLPPAAAIMVAAAVALLSAREEPRVAAAPVPAAAPPDRLRIRWDPRQEPWDGLTLLNEGRRPLEVAEVLLNGREDCRLRFVDPAKTQTAPGSVARMELVAYALFSLNTAGFFFDARGELARNAAGSAVLRTGDRAILVKPPRCGAIVRALVRTDRGTFEIAFDRPYTGR